MSAPAQLFDAPGPRGRARQRAAAVLLGLLVLAALALVLWRLGERGNLAPAKWLPFTTAVVWREYLLRGLVNTLSAAVIAIALAGALGLVLGVGRLSPLAPLRWGCSVVVEFFRAVPVLVMMIFAFWLYAYNGTFPSAYLALAGTVTGLTFYNAAVIAELIRSGVHTLPAGQAEAGLSVGLTSSQTLFAIQLPQALTAMLPALVGQLVVVLKDTALGYQITYAELLRQGEMIGANYGNIVPALIVVAVLFIVVNHALSVFAQWVERRLSRRGHVAGGAQAPEAGQEAAPR